MKPLGYYVRKYRKARGWTQNELAYRARLQPSVVSRIERGGDWRGLTLYTLAKALGVHPRRLLG